MNGMAISYDAVKELCAECNKDREAIYESIEIIKQKLNQVIENGFWVGADAIQFQARMNDKLAQLNSTANWINQITRELDKYATKMKEQEQSRANQMYSSMEG